MVTPVSGAASICFRMEGFGKGRPHAQGQNQDAAKGRYTSPMLHPPFAAFSQFLSLTAGY